MIRCFLQSKLAFVGGIALTLALAVALGIRQAGGELWIFIISILLLAMVGTLLTIFISNLVAGGCNQRILSILYVERMPEKFLKAFTSVPDGLKKGTMTHATAISYLSDGLLAAGRPNEALAQLERIELHGRISFELLVEDIRIRGQLLEGDLLGAKQGLRRYQIGLERAKRENPKLAENLVTRYNALDLELRFRQNKSVDLEKLQEMEEGATVILRRLELMLLRGEILVAQGSMDDGMALLLQVVDAGGELALVTRARAIMQQSASHIS